MDLWYMAGVAAAVAAGAVNNAGVLLQKKAVNDVPAERREAGFMRVLIRNPLWLLGLFLQVGVGAAAFMAAQALIGPALSPGIMASGLVVLALGSVRLMGETLSPSEWLGIALLITGTALLGLSGLDVPDDRVRELLTHSPILIRIAVFSAAMTAAAALCHLVSRKTGARRGIVMGFANGFLFSLSNFWLAPLIAVIAPVLTGRGSAVQAAVFIAACPILVLANLAAFTQIQHAFKFGQASNIIPVQQLSVQITPVIIYFFVFSLTPAKPLSTILIVSGASSIILAGFLLGRRQEAVEDFDKKFQSEI